MVEALSSALTSPRDMIVPAASLGDLSSPIIAQCLHYSHKPRPSPHLPPAAAAITSSSFASASRSSSRCFWKTFPCLQIYSFRSSRRGVRCQAMTETEPEGNDETENDVSGDGTSPPSVDRLVQNNGHPKDEFNIDQNKDDVGSKGLLDLGGSLEKSEGDLVTQNGKQEKNDDLEVASGSPLPGMKQQLGEPIRIPKATIDILKDQVFGFDTFFVTSHEPYEGGVLFKGNLRGKAAKSYEKITKRMQDRFGDEYKLFLLINPEDDKPVAVVVPRQTLQPESTAIPEWFAAGAFGLVTIFTLLLRNVPALQTNLLSTFDNLGLLKDGLPGALVTALVLGFHEIGHILVARDTGIKLGVPYFVPSWQTGSFGAITRILSIVANREGLIKLAAAGPLAGFSVGFVLLLLGFILPPADGIGIVVDPAVFHESFLAGGIAKLLLGEVLKEGSPLSINPLVLWAWAGLLINAINSIPAGELDGGRISFAIWGRKASARLTSVSLALLGISSLFNDVAFYWVVLIFFLQRGPIAPLSEEITEPENKYAILGVAVLLFGLLVCLPYPFPFANEGMNFDF
ncbi:probable zinc metalloprotease EGY2, chloroplastic isoform X1 [Elaeis guineensis]|uniref:Probable zinc metalloprotease EGY2, chloroplastic isoform X1 n=1 Tax=Elaeis guineensis var. tenera TaxID=51953 RepID=A0A6I9RGW4_ELAGV|nr:probable zinc metalloprotease EGY2, chloroplastic isoform X1 [Elaeis guineensis]